MSCKTENKFINEREFSVTQWPAEKALLNQIKLAKLFAKPMSTIIGSLSSLETKEEESEKIKMGAKAIGEGFSQLFEQAEPQELLDFIKECLIGVGCDGVKITNVNATFQTDSLSEMYQVFLFVLKVNYSNFIPGQLVNIFQQLANRIK